MLTDYTAICAGYPRGMRIDSLARRLRFAPPSPTESETIYLVEADLDQWAAIHRHGPLPISYLRHFGVRRNYPNLQRRYTRFFHLGWLTRPPRQFASFHARYSPMVYDLTPKAKAEIGGKACSHPPSRSTPFVHQLMQACFTASLELLAPAKGLRFVGRDEVLSHPKSKASGSQPLALKVGDSKLIPDDLFALERPDKKKLIFLLEIDRNTESIERHTGNYNTWARKVKAYDEMFSKGLHQERWGFPVATVLTVTTNEIHAQNLRKFVGQNSRYPERYKFAVEEGFGANWRVPKELLTTLSQIV